MKNITLETTRLQMRPITIADTNALFRLYGDQKVMVSRKIGTLNRAKSDAELELLLNHWHRHGYGIFAVIEKESGQFIGECGLREIARDKDGIEISYGLFPSHWGKGYATEAATAMLDYGFLTLALPKIYGIAKATNTSSLKILSRFGMLPESEFSDGTAKIVRSMLTREDYLNLQRTS